MTFLWIATAPAQDPAGLQRSPELGIAWRETPKSPLVIADVEPGTAAAKAGLMKGDVVISVNDEQVRSGAELVAFLKKVAPGDKLQFELRREGETLTEALVMPDSRVNMFGAFLQEAKGGRIVVSDVAPNTPAERAGLRQGDMLLSMAGKRPGTLAGLSEFMAKLVAVDKSDKSTEPIELTVERRGEDQPLKLVIQRDPAPMPARSPLPSRDLSAPNGRHLVLGIEVQEQGPRILVSRVMERRPAAVAGVQPGDVIVSVGRRPITSHAALLAAIAGYQPGDEVPLEITRGERRGVLKIKVTEARPNEEDVVLVASAAAPAVAQVPMQDERTLREEVQLLRARVEALEQVVKQLVQQLDPPQRQRP